MTIDNGNHLVLSGNHAVRDFAEAIGSASALIGPEKADFPFVDMASGERWTLRINDGLPWWIFDKHRRVPGTRVSEYLRAWRLLRAPEGAAVGDVLDCSGPLYDRLLRPLLVAALNVEPPEGAAALAAAIVRETLMQGGTACRPLVARDGRELRLHGGILHRDHAEGLQVRGRGGGLRGRHDGLHGARGQRIGQVAAHRFVRQQLRQGVVPHTRHERLLRAIALAPRRGAGVGCHIHRETSER